MSSRVVKAVHGVQHVTQDPSDEVAESARLREREPREALVESYAAAAFVDSADGARRRRMLLPLPFEIAQVQAFFLQFLPKPLLTPDQVELLRADNIVSDAAQAEGRTLKAFGIEPAAMEAIVPGYLWRFRKAGQFRVRGA